MKICAVIDDGVSVFQYPFLNHLVDSLRVTEEGIIPADPPKERTHGTLCAAVIRQYAPEVEIVSIQALEPETGSCEAWKIRKALEWCAKRNFTAINLSAASLSFREWALLRPTISLLLRQGTPLICAWHNTEKFSLYTNFTWTISVEKSWEMQGEMFRFQNRSFLEGDFWASSSHVLPIGPECTESFASQNSHAAPVLTSAVCKLPDIKKLGTAALFRAINPEEQPANLFHIRPLPDFLDQAVVLGQPIWPERLWMFERDSLNLEEAIKRQSPFFLAVFSGGEEELPKAIQPGERTLLGILYAGIASEEVRAAAYEAGCLFWEEQEYKTALERVPESCQEPNGPLVVIKGNPEEALSLVRQLQRAFIREGYRCLAFSDLPQTYALGLLFLPEAGRQWTDIRRYAEVFAPDVMLFCGEDSALPADLIITLKKDGVVFCTEEKEERVDTAGEELYQAVIAWLEG